MNKPKIWIVGVIIIAIVGYVVPRIGDTLFPKENKMTLSLDEETIKLLKQNQKSEVKVIIEGKEIDAKLTSDDKVEIKVSEEDDGKTAELQVVDEEGKELKKKDIVLNKPEPPKPKKQNKANEKFAGREVTTPDNFKFKFTKIERVPAHVAMYFSITNLSDDYRDIKLLAHSSILYTDLENQHTFGGYCITSNCGRKPVNTMPPNIPLKGNTAIAVDKNATKIPLAKFVYYAGGRYQHFELKDIDIPEMTQ